MSTEYEKASTSGGTRDVPPIVLESMEEYFVGFPMLVSVTYVNPDDGPTYLRLPKLDWIPPESLPISLDVRSLKTQQHQLTKPTLHDPPKRSRIFTLEPGQQRRYLLDLSDFALKFEPGSYDICVSVITNTGHAISNTVRVRVCAPSQTDGNEVIRLLSETDSEDHADWTAFITDNWRTVDISKLSAKARDALSFHLFLHRAVYGPTKIADIDITSLKIFAQGPLKAEAAVLRYEILSLRGDRVAEAEGRRIMKKWPSMIWRLEEIQQGEGLLTLLRSEYGAEQEFETPPTSYPYKP